MHARTKITVRYAETDKMGIVHHSNYPIWYEIARNDYIKMFGISYTDMENAGVMTPLLNLSCHYGIPALYEDELIIRTWVQTITAARIIFTYTVKRIEKFSRRRSSRLVKLPTKSGGNNHGSERNDPHPAEGL